MTLAVAEALNPNELNRILSAWTRSGLAEGAAVLSAWTRSGLAEGAAVLSTWTRSGLAEGAAVLSTWTRSGSAEGAAVRVGGEGERRGVGECIDDGDDDRDDGELERECEGVWDPLLGFHLFVGIGGVIYLRGKKRIKNETQVNSKI